MSFRPPPSVTPIPEEELQRCLPKRKISFTTYLMVSAAAFVGLPMIAYLTWMWSAQQRFDRQIAKIEAKDYPVSVAGLQNYYAIPSGVRDITPQWQEILNAVALPTYKNDAQGIPFADPTVQTPLVSKASVAQAQKFVQRHADILEAIHQAASLDGETCYPVTFGDGYMALLSHTQEMHNAVGLMRLEAHLAIVRNDPPQAVRAWRAGLAAAESLRREPILVTQLVRFVLLEQLIETLEELASSVALSESELLSLHQAVRAVEVRNHMRRGFIGEQALSLVAFQEADAEDLREMGQVRAGNDYLLTMLGTRHEDLTRYTHLMEEIIESLDHPWPLAIATAESAAAQAEQATTGLGEIRYALTKVCLISPGYPADTMRNAAKIDSLLAVTDVWLAAFRFRQRNGQLPKSVAELVPDFLSSPRPDPWAPSQPIQIQSRANERIVLSSYDRDDAAAVDSDLPHEVMLHLPPPPPPRTPTDIP